MYAVVETGGKQFRVEAGQTLNVETLDGATGNQIELGRVLVIGDNGGIRAGADVKDAKVTATIQANGRADKIIVFKFKRKKQYKRTIGHRQNYTTVKVDAIVG